MASYGERSTELLDGPGEASFPTVIGIGALVVAFVILVLFAIGYLFGRAFV